MLHQKVFLTLLPLFYLFLGFYVGLGLRLYYFSQIVGAGAIIGFLTYLFIMLAETLVNRTGNPGFFLVSPVLFCLLGWIVQRKVAHVT
jgi:lipopolysaccharide export LptBFGC system permease protein LptF